jgi:hypothetical protein
MTLHGSVDLAERLDGSSSRDLGDLVTPSPSPAARATLRALVDARIFALRAEVNGTLADPFPRRSRLPAPAEAAERMWAPYGELVTRTLARVRYELRALREEMAAALAALGPKEARLERLDAALFEATAEGRAALEDRMVAAIGRSFARRSAVAIAGSELLRQALDAGRDVILGVLEHDRRRLAALVAAPSDE